MAFKRSAVRSRLSPPKKEDSPNGLSSFLPERDKTADHIICFRASFSVLRSKMLATPMASKKNLDGLRLTMSNECPLTSPPPVGQVLFFCPLSLSGYFLLTIFFVRIMLILSRRTWSKLRTIKLRPRHGNSTFSFCDLHHRFVKFYFLPAQNEWVFFVSKYFLLDL